jgi:hypothetical protein
MSENPRRHVALALSVFGFAFLLALFPMRCLDTWWHMANGREIAQGRGIPHDNRYSFTFPDYEVTPTHWLFGLGAYGVHAVAGVSGLVFVKALLVGGTFLLCYLLALRRGAHPAIAAVCIALAVLASRPRFLERPHLFTMLGLVGFAWIIKLGDDGRRRVVWAIPPLAALWANVHAGALFGIGLAGIEATGLALQWLRARHAVDPDTERIARLRSRAVLMAGVTTAAMIAVMASPVGWGIYTYNLWHVNLDEVISLAEFRLTMPHEYPIFYLLLVAGIALLALDRKAVTPQSVLMLVVYGILGVHAVRGVPNFLLVASPFVAAGLTRVWAASSDRPVARRVNALLARLPVESLSAFLLLMPFVGHAIGGVGGKYRIGLGMAHTFFPEGAARFAAEHVPADRMFNDLSAGGYLAWHWHPGRGIFVDGRTNAYPPGFLKNLYRGRLTPALVDLQLRAWGLDAAILHFYRGRNRFWPHFDLRRWAVVFADDAGLVLLLRTPRNRPDIESHERRLGPHGFRALSDKLAPLGDSHIRQAIAASNAALSYEESTPNRPFTPRQRAKLLRRSAHGLRFSGDYTGAIARYREALALAPDLIDTRTNLAWAILESGDHETAIEEFRHAIDDGADHPETALGLGKALLAAGQRDAALKLLRGLVNDVSAPDVIREKARQALGE